MNTQAMGYTPSKPEFTPEGPGITSGSARGFGRGNNLQKAPVSFCVLVIPAAAVSPYLTGVSLRMQGQILLGDRPWGTKQPEIFC